MTVLIMLLTALVVLNSVMLFFAILLMAQRKPERHTYSTIACLEDAIAVIIDVEFEADALKARLLTARRILGQGRTSPHSYDTDQPHEKK